VGVDAHPHFSIILVELITAVSPVFQNPEVGGITSPARNPLAGQLEKLSQRFLRAVVI